MVTQHIISTHGLLTATYRCPLYSPVMRRALRTAGKHPHIWCALISFVSKQLTDSERSESLLMYTDEQLPEPVGFKALQIQRLRFHLTFSLFPPCYYNTRPLSHVFRESASVLASAIKKENQIIVPWCFPDEHKSDLPHVLLMLLFPGKRVFHGH